MKAEFHFSEPRILGEAGGAKMAILDLHKRVANLVSALLSLRHQELPALMNSNTVWTRELNGWHHNLSDNEHDYTACLSCLSLIPIGSSSSDVLQIDS